MFTKTGRIVGPLCRIAPVFKRETVREGNGEFHPCTQGLIEGTSTGFFLVKIPWGSGGETPEKLGSIHDFDQGLGATHLPDEALERFGILGVQPAASRRAGVAQSIHLCRAMDCEVA